ncbi:MAG: endopeptidase La [Bacilli bacterium]
MIKTNLPVLIIKDIVLFPYNEVRIEFDNLENKQLVSIAESLYDNHLLVVHPKDMLEEKPDISELPKIGVIAQIKMRMDMPNGKTRIILYGINRVQIHNYTYEDNMYEALVSSFISNEIDSSEEHAYTRSLFRHLEMYIKEASYMSNSIISQISGISNVDKLTDVAVTFLPCCSTKLLEYLYETDSTTRVEMIINDINNDIEIIHLEDKIEEKLQNNLNNEQKEFVLRERIKMIKEELGESYDKDKETDKLKEIVLNLNCPKHIKERLNYELNKLSSIPSISPEITISNNYIDWLIKLPWNNLTKDNYNLKQIENNLNKHHYGLVKIKDKILEYIAVKKNTHGHKNQVLCLVGPPGVGKTTLAISIAKSIGRKYTKISVGGINDEAEIVGHRKTYIGAMPGKIIQGMKKVGVSNPVFIIDEIDKMTKDIKGDPASSLLDILDLEQNSKFCDHYIEEEYDLSKVMFILTANYIEQIPNELKDRLEIIELSSYTEYEKLEIAKRHLIPKLEEELNIKDILFSDEIILNIIRNYTKEAGVRELTRLLSNIYGKIIKDKLLKNISVSEINNNDLITYLGQSKYNYIKTRNIDKVGVIKGLAYTTYGGDVLEIEVALFKGKGNLILTGTLGDVMKESAQIALSYIKSNSDIFKIDFNLFLENDFHIHVPEGATPKDGPSAGITITTAIISLLLKKEVSLNISMTGEITLTGIVLPIGGLKEKLIAAHQNKIKKVFIPQANKNDLEDIPKEILKEIKIVFVNNYLQIYNELFK